jgi:hypothetical protein
MLFRSIEKALHAAAIVKGVKKKSKFPFVREQVILEVRNINKAQYLCQCSLTLLKTFSSVQWNLEFGTRRKMKSNAIAMWLDSNRFQSVASQCASAVLCTARR